MGGNQSSGFSNDYLKQFGQHYVFLKEQNDPRFGLIKVYKKHENEEEVMVVKRMYASEEEYEYFQRELNVRLSFQHKNLLHLLGYQKESNSNLCGHSRVFELFSEYHSHNLKKEIQKRTASTDYFSESELWYLAEACLSVGRFMQDRTIYHGDFRPINIMLSDDGYVKIPDNGILTAVRNNYFKTLSGECRGYLSPELMRAFSKRESNPKYNVYKADVFSLGVTLLYASTLIRPNTVCYDWSQHIINTRGISDLLKKVEQRYSVPWRELLEVMLGLGRDEEGRPDFRGLYPLKIVPPQPQPQAQPQPHPQPQPQLRIEPQRKGTELKLIQTQPIEDGQYESYGYGNSDAQYNQYEYTSPAQVHQQQTFVQSPQHHHPPQQQQVFVSQQQQPVYTSQQIYASQPQTQLYASQPQSQVYVSQTQAPVKQYYYEQEQPIIQQNVIQQPLYQQSQMVYAPSQMETLPQQQIMTSQPVPQQQILTSQQLYNQQNVLYGQPMQQQIYSQPVETRGYNVNQFQVPTQQVQFQQVQSEMIPTQNIVQQQPVYYEHVKQKTPQQVLQTVNEERIEKYEDNDLDRRVKEALKATQDTIDRNTRMQSEAQKYQYGNV